MIKKTLTYAQNRICRRIENKLCPCFITSSYDVHGDTSYGDYLEGPYGDYYDIDSENPR